MPLHATLNHPGPLTQRESDVLLLLCQGKLRKQIAHTLHRSYGCISKQIESIAQKLDAHSAAEIVAKAVAGHLVDITLKAWLLIMTINCGLGDMDIDMRRQPRVPRPPVTRCYTRSTTPRYQKEA